MATYTLAQLSIYFGVNQSIIERWIAEKRLLTRRKEVKGDSVWIAKTGRTFLVQDIIDDWEKENLLSKDATNSEWIHHFRSKYGGSLEATLNQKPMNLLSAQEESDLSAWRYLASKED